ncbi:MAG: hypothetical protein M3Q07_06885, partial [Pseudobdellovibrionaceae bacterium]|nr:hypothetical protein [Pseudobdellovibrionaceae bacterium]
MSLDLLKTRGVPLESQVFTWKELVQNPISKLNDDAFTRVRVILMNGIEQEANRFQHAFARFSPMFRKELAAVRRIEHHQQTMVNWLLGPDHSPLDTTIGFEQTAIEITAAVARMEPDPYLAQGYRFGMLEDFDHLYRFSALMDRVEGRDSNNLLQSYTDVMPGRPTVDEHRHPEDDVRRHFDRTTASPLTKLNALTIVSAENQVRDYYMNVGPTYPDPIGRQLYAEIASIEEQHVTHYESMLDPNQTLLEQWLLHEACEVYNYYSCVESETNPRIASIWQRMLDYELGQLAFVSELFKTHERRDPAEILPETLSAPIPYAPQREFIRDVLRNEINLRTNGTEFVPLHEESALSLRYREQVNRDGSPSQV